jgi:hypothetical protein
MPLYQIADLVLDSAIALPSVPRAGSSGPAWTFTIDRRQTRMTLPAWYHHASAAHGRRPWRSLGRHGDDHVVRFWRRGQFVVSSAKRRITCYPCPSASLDTVRQLLVGHVMPLVFADAGSLVLHASAVQMNVGVVAFVGPTGVGKSTIASELGRRGYPLVADDCVVVESENGECRVKPVDVGLRVCVGRGLKTRVVAGALGLKVRTEMTPLGRVYLLDSSGTSPRVHPIAWRQAVVALLSGSFQIGMDQRAQIRRNFELLTAVSAHAAVRRLSCPRGLRYVPALVDVVLEDTAG